MNDSAPQVHTIANGEIAVWVDGGIHIKTRDPYGDPVEMSDQDAKELAALLLRLLHE